MTVPQVITPIYTDIRHTPRNPLGVRVVVLFALLFVLVEARVTMLIVVLKSVFVACAVEVDLEPWGVDDVKCISTV